MMTPPDMPTTTELTALFPFGFPGSTALYLTLYVATLAIHAALLSYVLFGAGYLAVTGIARLRRADSRVGPRPDPIGATLRDWLPFALGAAITAGVAPLLFVQILYQDRFYTANLLLFHRWMAMIPALMLGFYLLYLGKSGRVQRGPAWIRAAAAAIAFGCFAFVAYTFTENHLLALDRDAWVDMYAEGRLVYRTGAVAPRALMWLLGSVPVAAAALAWQLRHHDATATPDADDDADTNDRPSAALAASLGRLGRLALAGLVGGALCAVWYARAAGEPAAFDAVTSPLARPYLALACAGALAQAIAWGVIAWRTRGARAPSPAAPRGLLVVVAAGAGAMIAGAAVTREAVRLASVNLADHYPHHARAASSGGLVVFLLFLAINAAVIAWCLRLVRRGVDIPPGQG